MAKIDLLINVPLSGTVRFVDWYPAREWQGKQMSAQVRLKGTFGGNEGEIYLPAVLLPQLQKDGMVMEAGTKEHNGAMIPQYRWTHSGPVTVYKAQEGRTTRTTVTSGNGHPSPSAPTPPFVAPRASQGPTNAIRASLDQALATGGKPQMVIQDGWGDLTGSYTRARDLARKMWGDGMSDEAIVACAATIFIRASQLGLTVPPTPTQAQAKAQPVESFENFPEALEDDSSDLPF